MLAGVGPPFSGRARPSWGRERESRVSATESVNQPSKRRRARRTDNPRTKRVNLSFNDTEFDLVSLAAERASQSPGAYAARAAVSVAKGEIAPIPVDERDRLQALADARVALNRIGNNLNQVAHVLNAEGDPERIAGWIAAVVERVERAVHQVDAATIAMLDR
jgi:septal ring factor EnvC (AmiA/AmiB activator)